MNIGYGLVLDHGRFRTKVMLVLGPSEGTGTIKYGSEDGGGERRAQSIDRRQSKVLSENEAGNSNLRGLIVDE